MWCQCPGYGPNVTPVCLQYVSNMFPISREVARISAGPYLKTMRLSAAGRDGSTTGEVLNHMQLDAQRVGPGSLSGDMNDRDCVRDHLRSPAPALTCI
jgi:hypothetical protein